MKLTLVTLAAICTGIVMLGGALACDPTPATPNPTPTPVPMQPVAEVYAFYQNEKDVNETRLKKRVEQKEWRAFYGVVDGIDGTKVQFLHTVKPLEKDTYLECKFQEERPVRTLDKGEVAYVAGTLDSVNGTVKFDNCQLASMP